MKAAIAILQRKRELLRWAFCGMPLPPPPGVKRQMLLDMQARFGLRGFIETGTFKGDTLAALAQTGIPCTSIELSDALYEKARRRFAGQAHITLYHGDSGTVLPPLIADLKEPTLFWLDGHYSAGHTAHGALASPISAELDAILASPIAGHVVLIDDVHEFTGQGGYPELGSLLTSLADHPHYRAYVQANIIVIEPK